MKREPIELPIFNRQPPERRVDTDLKGALEIQEIFATIQGEGPFAGTPAVFVRLAGCNLQCPLCDTDYTSQRRLMGVHGVLNDVGAAAGAHGDIKLIVLTGGEPFRQACGPFIKQALAQGYRIQIETNGTLWDTTTKIDYTVQGLRDVSIVCSPKTGKVNRSMHAFIHAYKYVMKAGMVSLEDGLPMSALDSAVKPARPHTGYIGDIFLQPCDERDPWKNEANVRACVDSCMKFGYRYCHQIHKLIGMP